MALGNEVNERNGPNKVKKQNAESGAKIGGNPGKKGEKRKPPGDEGGGEAGGGKCASPPALALNGHSKDSKGSKEPKDSKDLSNAGPALKPPSYAAAARATGATVAAATKEQILTNEMLEKVASPAPKDTDEVPKLDKVCPMNNNNLTSISTMKINGTSSEKAADSISASNGAEHPDRVIKEEAKESSPKQDNCVNENSVPLVNGHTKSDESKEDKPIVNGLTEKEKEKEKEDAKDVEEESEEKKGEQEVVFIQDLGFTVKIVSPGSEPFDIQVSSMELVQEIHQLLMDREDTCHRTCFSLQLDGVTLDNFAELKNIEGLKEASIIKVVEEPYTVREARIHVRHVRDLLKSLDSADAYNGIECSSLAFLNIVTQGDIIEKKKSRPESVDCTPPDFIMPGSKDRPLLPLHPSLVKENKGTQCLKVLTTSGWNPPPGPRKMNGDLLYLYVSTMEDKHFHITACPRGFYLNQCTEETFDPRPDIPSHLCHSLIELLSMLSPIFKRTFINVQKRKTQKHPFERVATPYQLYQWVSPVLDHTIDAIRAEDTFSSKLGYEEHIPGQTRDWNEELQTTRELPRKTLPERLLRERAIFKVHSDFVTAATRGAMAVVDGNVMAINPGEDAKMQMFIWNNIFFSLGFDVRDHYKELGGDAAAFVAPRNDLQGVRVYNAVDLEGLYTLGTVVVDYRGLRVTAQSIIPGILEKEQEQSVIYGSIDFGKTVLTHPKYMELLSKAGQQLKILPHSVVSAKGESVELCSSVECKGIVGNDGRYYILDLLRTFPPDVNFLKLENDELRDDIKAMGFPIIHKHKLCCLRQELVDSFVEARYFMFIRYAAFHLQQLGAKKHSEKDKENKETEKETTEEPEITKAIEDVKETPVKTEKDPEVKEKSRKELKREKQRKEAAAREALAAKETSEDAAEDVSKDDDIEKEVEKVLENGKNDSDSSDIQLIMDENDTEIDADEAKKIVESITDSMTGGDDKQEFAESTRSIVMAAAKAVGSLKTTEFDVRFNPDVYSDGIEHAGTPEELSKQRHLVKEAAAFLLTTQIPAFVRECLEQGAAPLDGAALVEALHARGVNARYLGRVALALAQHPPLAYLHSIAIAELLTRAAKHIFTAYLQCLDATCLAGASSHFLNCLIGSCPAPAAGTGWEGGPGGRRPRRSGRRPRQPLAPTPTAWTALNPKSLFNQIRQELKAYWGFDLQTTNMESTIEKYELQKISILRSFCLKVGLQILLREYDFENKNKPPFNGSDITNIFPVVKHINPRASDAYNFYTTGQSKIQAGQVRDGHELITEALNLLNNVYGAMHPEIAQCLRMVARLCYVAGEHRDAMAYQQKAVLMSERVNGVDHPYTITEYTHLALYCFANSQVTTALKLLYRARYLALIVCGENHPEIALLDSNISLILHAVGEYELALRFLEGALALTARCHGARSLKAAAQRHLLARTLSCLGDFRGALAHEKEAYAVYKARLGPAHDKTREAADCLRHLAQQAVALQKRLSAAGDAPRGAPAPPPLRVLPPSMGSVLDMLNVVNGILFVQISQQDIEHFKAELEKRHQLKELPPSDGKSKAEESSAPAQQASKKKAKESPPRPADS